MRATLHFEFIFGMHVLYIKPEIYPIQWVYIYSVHHNWSNYTTLILCSSSNTKTQVYNPWYIHIPLERLELQDFPGFDH